jgi:hypothetical protein
LASKARAPLEHAKKSVTHLREPATDIVPPNAHNIAALHRAAIHKVGRAVAQQCPVTKAEVVHKVAIKHFDVRNLRLLARCGDIDGLGVAADEALVSLADDPRLASPAEDM